MGTLIAIFVIVFILSALFGGDGSANTMVDDPFPPGFDDPRYDNNFDGKLDDFERSVQWHDWEQRNKGE